MLIKLATQVVLWIILSVSMDIHGQNSDSKTLVLEIENELKSDFPSLKEARVTFNAILQQVSSLSELVSIIDSGTADTHYIICVHEHKESVKDILKAAVIALDNVYTESNDRLLKFSNVFESLKLYVIAVENEELISRTLICINLFEETILTFPDNLQNALACLDEIEFPDVAIQFGVNYLLKTKVQESDKESGRRIENILEDIDESVDDLHEDIAECVEALEKKVFMENMYQTLNKDSVGTYYKEVYSKLRQFLEETQDLIDVRGKRVEAENSIKESTLSITNSVKSVSSFRNDLAKVFNATDLLGDDFTQCILRHNNAAAEILARAFEGIEACSDIIEEKRKHVKTAISSIELILKMISNSLVEHLNSCVSEDYSTEGLAQSVECIYLLEINHRDVHESSIYACMMLAADLQQEKVMSFKQEVESCTQSVVETAGKERIELVENINKCVQDIAGEEHDEL